MSFSIKISHFNRKIVLVSFIYQLIAKQKLLSELEKGRRSGEEEGYFDAADVFRELGARYDD